MRLLFLGCSWTYGCELADGQDMKKIIEQKRFSTIIGKKLNAEVINLADNGMSNHGIARIFLKQDLSKYDIIFVQMTLPERTEWYDSTGMFHKAKILAKIKECPNRTEVLLKKLEKRLSIAKNGEWDKILPNLKRFMTTGNILEGKEWWEHYYEEIYTDEYGNVEERLIYNLIKNKLVRMNKKHVISTINPDCTLPIDINLKKGKYPRAKGNHPNALGHIMIASHIMRLL